MTKEDWFWGLLGLVLIGLGLYAAYEFLSFFIVKLNSLNPNVAAAIIGGMATVLAGTLAVLLTQHQARKRAAEDSHRDKKVEIYKKFLETVSRMMAGENKDVPIKALSQKELIKYMVEFKTELILWASPQVIKSQLDFEKSSKTGEDIFTAVNNLHLAIRADIGLSNRGLSDYELVKMYLKDPDEVNNLKSSNKSSKKDAKSGASS